MYILSVVHGTELEIVLYLWIFYFKGTLCLTNDE